MQTSVIKELGNMEMVVTGSVLQGMYSMVNAKCKHQVAPSVVDAEYVLNETGEG
jgi:hypothetical protein